MIVIDTHALVWLVQGDPRLGATAREIIEESRSVDGVYIPAIVPWEIAMLVDKDRVSLGLAVDAWFGHILASHRTYQTYSTMGGSRRRKMGTGNLLGSPLRTGLEKRGRDHACCR